MAMLVIRLAPGLRTSDSTTISQRFERVRFHERDLLARELHDTFAHHVSAIAIRAQAGQVLARSGDLGGAAEALAVGDDEASRTLTEMRSVVRTLRHGDDATTMPVPRGVADIQQLATTDGALGPLIEVESRGELDDLRPGVQAALFRVAQESVTNAKRHARHATRIHVLVAGDREAVRMGISADGDAASSGPGPSGYGLAGRQERVTLLGGTLEAGARSPPRLDRPGHDSPIRGADVTIRVLVADDQAIIRTGLATILRSQPDIDVIGQAADGREAVALARRLRPDVCLFDIRVPHLDGVEAPASSRAPT